jgi:hypothetical protein
MVEIYEWVRGRVEEDSERFREEFSWVEQLVSVVDVSNLHLLLALFFSSSIFFTSIESRLFILN